MGSPQGTPHDTALGTVEALRRQSDYWWTVYRRTWRGTVVASFLNPLLYVLAMGVLLGGFIAGDPAKLEGATSYLAFIAPGLVAAQSLQTAVGETTYPVLGSLKWTKVYFGMHATPLRPADIMNANLVFVLVRLAVTCGVFMVVMAPFGVFTSVGGAVVAFLASVLVGISVGACVYAWSVGTTMESSFALIQRLGLMPQFLFAGAFFPISNLSPAMEWFARLTPLWHGVDLARMGALGTLRPGIALVHVVYLLVLGAIGYRLGLRRLTRRLVA